MTVTLDLPPDLEERLKSEAARRGLSPSGYLLELVKSTVPEAPPAEAVAESLETGSILSEPWPEDEPRPTTGAELVAYWERHGLIGTRPDITDSLEHARELRRKAERRDWS
jgi:hypothetical protein